MSASQPDIIDTLKLAKISGFKNNCALNALVEPIVENLARATPDAQNEFLRAFRTLYSDSTLTFDQLLNLLRSMENPVHLEVLVGPVLRSLLEPAYLNFHRQTATSINVGEQNALRMLTTSSQGLAASDVQYIAFMFGLNLESILNDKKTNELAHAGNIYNVPGAPVVKIWNTGYDHWEREELNDNKRILHNAYYADNNLAKIHEAIVKAARAKKWATLQADINASISSNPLSSGMTDDMFQNIGQGVDKILEVFKGVLGGDKGKESIFDGIINILGVIFKAMIGLMPIMKNLTKMFNNSKELVEADYVDQPEMGMKFNKYAKKIAETDKDTANTLYDVWRSDVEADKSNAWALLLDELISANLSDDANMLLAKHERTAKNFLRDAGFQQTLRRFEQVQESYSKLGYSNTSQEYQREFCAVRLQFLNAVRKAEIDFRSNPANQPQLDANLNRDLEHLCNQFISTGVYQAERAAYMRREEAARRLARAQNNLSANGNNVNLGNGLQPIDPLLFNNSASASASASAPASAVLSGVPAGQHIRSGRGRSSSFSNRGPGRRLGDLIN